MVSLGVLKVVKGECVPLMGVAGECTALVSSVSDPALCDPALDHECEFQVVAAAHEDGRVAEMNDEDAQNSVTQECDLNDDLKVAYERSVVHGPGTCAPVKGVNDPGDGDPEKSDAICCLEAGVTVTSVTDVVENDPSDCL